MTPGAPTERLPGNTEPVVARFPTLDRPRLTADPPPPPRPGAARRATLVFFAAAIALAIVVPPLPQTADFTLAAGVAYMVVFWYPARRERDRVTANGETVLIGPAKPDPSTTFTYTWPGRTRTRQEKTPPPREQELADRDVWFASARAVLALRAEPGATRTQLDAALHAHGELVRALAAGIEQARGARTAAKLARALPPDTPEWDAGKQQADALARAAETLRDQARQIAGSNKELADTVAAFRVAQDARARLAVLPPAGMPRLSADSALAAVRDATRAQQQAHRDLEPAALDLEPAARPDPN